VEQEGTVMGFIVGRQVDEEWEIENIAVTGSRGVLGWVRGWSASCLIWSAVEAERAFS